MRSIRNPRLRQSVEVSVSVITNNNYLRNEEFIMEEKQITPEQINPNARKVNSGKKNHKKHNGSHRDEGGAGSKTDVSVSDNKTVKTTGFNVFYPAVRLANRHKYAVSHYEINLSPVDLLNASAFQNRYYQIETVPTITSCIKLGGPEFHRRVMMAATQANAKFLVTTGNLVPLVNAFYGHMYNSRVMYALLCTAWRCQNQVNVIDEDQRYFSPLLNDHEIKNFTQGYNTSTLARETDGATFTTNTVRQGYCFSDPTSNGVWANSVLTPTLQYVRLTSGWKSWIEEKFMRSFIVDPTDFSSVPRFVVFWPTAAGVTATGTEGLETFNSYQAYGDQDQRYTLNATIQNLITYINAMAAHQAQFVADYPQLELMWEYLGMSSSNTNFSRDLDAKSLPVVHSYSVSKLIRSASAGNTKIVNRQDGNAMRYYYQDVPTSFYISRDPAEQEQSFKTFEMASSSRTVANITYLDRVELDEGDFAICTGLIAPLSLQLMIYNSSNHPYKWDFPLVSLLTDTNIESITPEPSTFGGQVYNFVRALTEQQAILTQEAGVLPRYRLLITGGTSPLHPYATMGSTGLPICRFNGSYYNCFVPYYNLKDYYVPEIEAAGWKDAFLDSVLTKQ